MCFRVFRVFSVFRVKQFGASPTEKAGYVFSEQFGFRPKKPTLGSTRSTRTNADHY